MWLRRGGGVKGNGKLSFCLFICHFLKLTTDGIVLSSVNWVMEVEGIGGDKVGKYQR